jgi:peptidoglycan/xylan/chitin deacetylase (PgdA/CDA1 family)
LIASLSLDLDNQWSYQKTHGDPGWESFPTYLDLVVPRVLALLAERGLSITFFVVGQDAADERNRAALASIAAAGHEIGNHSYRHEPWFHLYTAEEIDAELARTEDALEAATGQRPVGFRGPGFTLSEPTLRVLSDRGYRYDCSTLPTWIGPLARAYYFMTAKLTEEEKRERELLFGTWSEALRPLKPYAWDLGGPMLPEIPVTTMPLFRVPIHVSYVLWLGVRSPALARLYFDLALDLCRLTGTEPSILLHPLDFLGGDDVKELAFFPAMNLPGEVKAARAAACLDGLARRFEVVPMRRHAEIVAARGPRPRPPSFPRAHGRAHPDGQRRTA